MHELSLQEVIIDDPFWNARRQANKRVAIYHQWEKLESTRCIDNFRIAAGEKEGFREGWFFADSDAYKWLDAAARIQACHPDDKLKGMMDDFIDLLARTQMQDGYLYTYNQIHFPGERWGNLMIEHELYCHGHLIEAAISHFQATGESTALSIARKAADLLVKDFMVATPDKTSGHEEIEIALLRLYLLTDHRPYLELAGQFLERRGCVWPFFTLILRQNSRVTYRGRIVREQRLQYQKTHPDLLDFHLPANNVARKAPNAKIRWVFSNLLGKNLQQYAPIRRQAVPVGHSVRFGYLETAVSLYSRMIGDETLMPTLEKCWERMVTRRMYVTGGLGSLPEIEGFGRDFELDPELAYAETCAGIASLFWNWEMIINNGYAHNSGHLNTQESAQYADLFEWQLYNAVMVGMGLEGNTYLYNNPLLSRGGILRRPWFQVPCCPSNLSRTIASLGKYIYSYDDTNVWVHQYIGNRTSIGQKGLTLEMQSGVPWNGSIRLRLDLAEPVECTFHFRLPSWAGKVSVSVNGQPNPLPENPPETASERTASGFDPRKASYLPIRRTWSSGDSIELEFEMPVVLQKTHPRVRGHAGKVAITRGPLVYCLETPDNPDVEIFTASILPETLKIVPAADLLGGILIISGKTSENKNFTAIPYHLWANRGESQMTVWLNTL